MLLDLHVRFKLSFDGRRMSQNSRELAAYAKQFIDRQPSDEATLLRNQLLNEGFKRLRENLENEFTRQIEEFHGEPGWANTLSYDFSGKTASVQHRNNADFKISLAFDDAKREVIVSGEQPTKLQHIIKVELNSAATAWYFRQGTRKNDLSACNENLDWLVKKFLLALFAVSA